MNYYADQFITALIPIITPVIIGALTWLFKELLQLIITKRNESKNKQIRDKTLELWYKVEEYFRKHPELQRVINDKYDMLKGMINAQYPSITDEQIDDLIESISGLINYKKIEGTVTTEATETPVATAEATNTVIVEPVVKYMTSDGIELQPVLQPVTPSTTE